VKLIGNRTPTGQVAATTAKATAADIDFILRGLPHLLAFCCIPLRAIVRSHTSVHCERNDEQSQEAAKLLRITVIKAADTVLVQNGFQ
jgi:hypothetical protein